MDDRAGDQARETKLELARQTNDELDAIFNDSKELSRPLCDSQSLRYAQP